MGSISRVLPNVCDMNDALATQQPPSRCVGRSTRRAVLPKPLAQTRCSTYCDRIEAFAVACPKCPRGRIAKGYCLLDHRLEHWVEIAGRGIDDLQHLGSGGLLLQGLARLGEEPRILHCDHGLCCEILQQRDLLVGERSDLLAVDHNIAE